MIVCDLACMYFLIPYVQFIDGSLCKILFNLPPWWEPASFEMLLVFMSYHCLEKMDMIFHLETVCEMKSDPSFRLTLVDVILIKQLSKTETQKSKLRRKNEVVRQEMRKLGSPLAWHPAHGYPW